MNPAKPSVNRYLDIEIDAARRRLVARRSAIGTAAAWALIAFVTWLIADAAQAPLGSTTLVILLTTVGLAAIVAAIAVRLGARRYFADDETVAKVIEKSFPEIDARLFAALEAQRLRGGRQPGYLEDQVTREVVLLARSQSWRRVVPAWQISVGRGATFLALLFVVASSIATTQAPFQSLSTLTAERDASETPRLTAPSDWQVSPGDIELEKGRSLLVTVELPSPSPEPLELVLNDGAGAMRRLPLEQSLSDPIYSAQINQVQTSMTYRIETASSQSRSYRVTVYELPRLEELSVSLNYPEFTQLSSKSIQDPRRIQAVEGTRVEMTAKFNQPLAHARWEGQTGTIEFEPLDPELNIYQAELVLRETDRLDLDMASSDGREPALKTSLKLTALPNKPAEIRWIQPTQDPQVSPIEELDVAGQATDDFGLASYGVTFQLVGRDPIEMRLEDGTADSIKAEIRDQFALENFEVRPGQLMQLHLWAEDRIEGGEVRRSLSDLLVAEVRDFEQIFRQADPSAQQQASQPPGEPGGGPQQQQAQDLIERQKQALLASWNLVRRGPEGEGWRDDVELVLQEQMAIVEEARPLVAELPEETISQDERLLIERAMLEAVDRLLTSIDEMDNTALQQATAAQQVILQALISNVGNEFDVQEQSQQQGQPSQGRQAGAPSQQQLEQLQLDNEQNRYEQESQAQEITNPEQQQLREQLNRLADLARRQKDLNEQIKKLQSELEAAEDEAAEEVLRQQLERLREEQEQVQRDAESLEEDFSQDPNASAENKEQIEQARESAQKTAKELSSGNVDQALAEGRRAEQALDQLQEELQQRSGNAFQEELNRLNDQLSDLAETQAEVDNNLERFFDNESGDLRDRDRTTPLVDSMKERSEKLTDALNDLQTVIEASEDSEPLLSDELYDAFRRAKQNGVETLADDSRRWAENGLPDRSVPLEEQLSDQIDQLRESVARSAELAGADQVSALKMAEARIRELSSEVAPQAPASGKPEGDPSEGDPSKGEPGEEPGTGATEGEPANPENPEGGSPGERGQPGESGSQEPGPSQAAEESPESQQEGEGQGGSGESSEQQPPSESEPMPGQGQQPGQSGQGETEQDQPGQGQPGQGQAGLGQPGEPGQEGEASPNESPSPPGNPQSPTSPNGQQPQQGGSSGGAPLSAQQLLDRLNGTTGPGGNPIMGDEYRDWMDRMREVENLVPSGPLREEAARIRQAAAEMRRDLQRHSKVPDPEEIESMLVKPLDSLARRVANERLRLEGKDATVRLDSDPVPAEFAEEVREYFQRLGAGRKE